jgi:hypothetical protein
VGHDPISDLVEIVARADRPAYRQEQNLRERMRDAPRLPIVLDQPEMVQKQSQLRSVGKIQNRDGLRITPPAESRQPNPKTAVNPSSAPCAAAATD